MTRCVAALLALLTASTACNQSRVPAQTPVHGSAEVHTRPGWLPPDTAAQLALLSVPPRSTVDRLAAPVYPALERFAYAPSRPFTPAEAQASAARIQQQLEASELLYTMQAIDPSWANPIAQYGPPPQPEPDPWVKTVTERGRFELAWARPGPTAREYVEAGNRALAAGDPAAATQSFLAAATADPEVPGLWVALGRVHAASGDDAAAEAAFLEALGIDARYFDAHLELALLYERRGATQESRAALAHALAIHPVSPRAQAAALRLGTPQQRPQLPPVFIEVASSGAIVVGSAPTPGARAYASCHAALRHEPALRSELLDLPAEPYQLSLGEERLCAEVLLVSLDPEDPDERALRDALGAVANRGELTAFVLFEVLGHHRPEWLRLAPEDLFDEVVNYTRLHVLSPAK